MQKKLYAAACVALMALLSGCGASDSSEESTQAEKINEYYEAETVEYDASELVELGAYDSFTVSLTGDYSVSDEDVKEEIESEIDGLKSYNYISKNVTEEGDTINIDLSFDVEGVDTSEDSLDDYNIVLGQNFMELDGFDEQLIGKECGEENTYTFSMTFPDDYGVEDYQGKEAEFHVRINGVVEVYDMTWDLLDDSFVYANFGYLTVDEYKEAVRSSLESSMESQKESDMGAAAVDQLLADSTIKEVPEGLAELRIAQYKNYYVYQANQNGMSLSDYLASYNLTEEAWDEELETYMDSMVKKELIYMAVAEKEGIADNEENYSSYLAGMKNTVGMDEDDFDDVYPENYCRLLYCEQTVLDLLAERVTVE